MDVEHEDLSSLVKRYRPICKHENKLLLFLLCEYEHTPTRENKINVDLWREEYLPEDKAEEYWIKGDKEIIRDVILGTDVANVLEVPLSDSDLKRKFSY